MVIPLAVQIQIDNAEREMHGRADHALLPAYRQRIYSSMDALDDATAKRWRGWLGALTARRALPVWDRSPHFEPGDFNELYLYPEGMLALAERILQGEDIVEQAHRTAGYNHYVSGNLLGDSAEEMDTDDLDSVFAVRSAYTYAAALAALRTALCNPIQARYFAELSANETLRDESEEMTYKNGNRDTASCAVVAVAGADWMPFSDPQERRSFWTWWLQETMSNAYERAARVKS